MITEFNLEKSNSKVVVVGDKFGRLTVLETGKRAGRKYFAVCQCDCGSDPKAIRFESLLSGLTSSCGCYQRQQSTTHGLTKSPHYKRWLHMIDRCTNESCAAYKDYGGRGIKVCDRWLDVANFVADLPDGYFDGAEIDRIDNDGDYEPGNVRWATTSDNCDNRRSGRYLTHNGKTQSISRWAEETGINEGTLRSRIDDSGWSISDALEASVLSASESGKIGCASRWAGHTAKPKKTPRHLLVRRFEYQGKNLSIREISDLTGISVDLLRKRICERGWPIEKATVP